MAHSKAGWMGTIHSPWKNGQNCSKRLLCSRAGRSSKNSWYPVVTCPEHMNQGARFTFELKNNTLRGCGKPGIGYLIPKETNHLQIPCPQYLNFLVHRLTHKWGIIICPHRLYFSEIYCSILRSSCPKSSQPQNRSFSPGKTPTQKSAAS